MSATFNENTVIPVAAYKELFRSLNQTVQPVDLYTNAAKKRSSARNIKEAIGAAPVQYEEADFLGEDSEPVMRALSDPKFVIITLPSPDNKYAIIEACMSKQKKGFFLIQTTVMNSRRLNDLVKRYNPNVNIVFPYRRINFGVVPCPFDTLWIGINIGAYVPDRIIFSAGWLTERQMVKRQKLELKKEEHAMLFDGSDLDKEDPEYSAANPPTWADVTRTYAGWTGGPMCVIDTIEGTETPRVDPEESPPTP